MKNWYLQLEPYKENKVFLAPLMCLKQKGNKTYPTLDHQKAWEKLHSLYGLRYRLANSLVEISEKCSE